MCNTGIFEYFHCLYYSTLGPSSGKTTHFWTCVHVHLSYLISMIVQYTNHSGTNCSGKLPNIEYISSVAESHSQKEVEKFEFINKVLHCNVYQYKNPSG